LVYSHYNGSSYFTYFDSNDDKSITGDDKKSPCIGYEVSDAEKGVITKTHGMNVEQKVITSIDLESCTSSLEAEGTSVCFTKDAEPKEATSCQNGVLITYAKEFKENDTISVKFDNEVKTYTIKK
jgi:hypothetical protein